MKIPQNIAPLSATQFLTTVPAPSPNQCSLPASPIFLAVNKALVAADGLFPLHPSAHHPTLPWGQSWAGRQVQQRCSFQVSPERRDAECSLPHDSEDGLSHPSKALDATGSFTLGRGRRPELLLAEERSCIVLVTIAASQTSPELGGVTTTATLSCSHMPWARGSARRQTAG